MRIDSVHGRLRAIVADVPDAPVSRSVVRMGGGQKGLFVNSRSLCVKPKRNRATRQAAGPERPPEKAPPPAAGLGLREAQAPSGAPAPLALCRN